MVRWWLPILRPLVRAASGGSRGSSLLTVLVVLTVSSLLAGAALAVVVQQRRFMRHDVHRLQARYAAEAGVYAALTRLERDPSWRPRRAALPLFEGTQAVVSVRPFGGYYLVESEATVRRARSGVRAVVGARAPAVLDHAVVLGDGDAVLSVTGRTRIRGDLLLGPRGLRESALQGVPFRGVVDGAVLDGGTRPLPAFDPTHVEATLRALDGLLERPPPHALDLRRARRDGAGTSRSDRDPSGGLPERPVFTAVGPVVLSAADTLLWQAAADLLVRGDLTLTGGFRFPPGSRLAASGRLRMTGTVTGRGGLLYGREAVEAGGEVSCAAQLLSRERVTVGGRAVLRYPSVLYVAGVVEDGRRRGTVELGGRAVVDGTVVYPTIVYPSVPDSLASAPDVYDEGGRVVIGPDARLRGSVYAATALELRGPVEGSVLAQQVLHRAPPRTYLGWLVDAHIDMTARPGAYVLPVGLEAATRLGVLAWEPVPLAPPPSAP